MMFWFLSDYSEKMVSQGLLLFNKNILMTTKKSFTHGQMSFTD